MPDYQPLRGTGLYDLVDGAHLPGHRIELSPFVDGRVYRAGGLCSAVFCCWRFHRGEPAVRRIKVNPWLEAHTSFSMVACGAFALACIAGVMFLVQERQLKTRHPSFNFLPASADHGVVGRKFAFVMAGFRPLHGWARDRIFDRRPDQLGTSGMVHPGLVRLRRHHRRPNTPRHGGQVGCDPVDRRI